MSRALMLSFVLTSILPLFPADQEVRDIPTRYDFPASRQRLENERYDVGRTRIHAWRVFAGLASEDEDQVPVFRTWYSKELAFADKQAQPSAGTPRWLPLERSMQFVVGRVDAVGRTLPLVSVLFNRPAYEFIRQKRLYLKSTLEDLRPHLPTIPEFPNNAVVIKAVWWPIRKDGLSVLPVWDNNPQRKVDCGVGHVSGGCQIGNEYTTWNRIVAIDPHCGDEQPGRVVTIRSFDYTTKGDPAQLYRDFKDVPVVPLSRFYYWTFGKDDRERYKSVLGNFDTLLQRLYEPDATPSRLFDQGDIVALVGMHVMTKELHDWVWSTFWWHDQPNLGEYACNRPDCVQSRWSNYLMDVAVDADVPREPDQGPNITFNPWLEGGMSKGLVSNCLGCHQRSVWPLPSTAVDPRQDVIRGHLPLDHEYYFYVDGAGKKQRRIRLDYLWSIADHAR